jgi:AraC-like DNA-binding protein
MKPSRNNPVKMIKKKYTSGRPGNVLKAEYFYYDTAPNYNKELAIVCGGYEKCAPDFEINRSNYPYFFVKYTVRGKGFLEINKKTLPLRPGVLTGFEPGTPHRYRSDPSDPMEHIFVTFVGTDALRLFRKSLLSQRHYIEATDPEDWLKLCRKILDVGLQKSAFSQEICCSYLRILLLEEVNSHVGINAKPSIAMTTYQKCKRYINDNFSFIQSPADVAAECEVDVRYLASLFKKYDHTSAGHYIMSLKLNKAANLLLTTDDKIKVIAEKVGFCDPYHFSKNFKQFHGRSPNHFRNEHM